MVHKPKDALEITALAKQAALSVCIVVRQAPGIGLWRLVVQT